jgi:hypothetical protein
VLRVHLLDARFPRDVLVAGVGDLATGDLAWEEGAFQANFEPFAEFTVVGEGAPDAGDAGFELQVFLDPVSHHATH